MKQNTGVWAGIVAVITVMALGSWWVVNSNQRSAAFTTLGSNATTTTEVASTSDASVSGRTTETTNPLLSPHGNAAGGIVDVKNMTVADVVLGLGGTSQFASMFTATGGVAKISGTGKYTVFVPTDGAFNRQVQGTVSGMTSIQKMRFVQYHIITGRAIDTDAMTAGSVQTASGDVLNFSFGTNKIPMVGSALIITQYNCKNGVVYTINNVLLPPKK